MTAVDPAIIGVWIVPGLRRTYEVDDNGGYYVADPETPIYFEDGGAVMIWEDEAHDRLSGTGLTPEGAWRGRDTGAEWRFAPDGSYEVRLDGVTDTGIWALRRDGAALWTRELVAMLTTDGATVTFALFANGEATYGYTAGAGVWTLHDATTWAELARFVAPDRIGPTSASSPPRP